jgi:Tfp pilus assembly protein PilV
MGSTSRTKSLLRRLRSQGGVSLIELLIAMIIMIVVLGGVYTIWFGLQRSYSFTNDDISAQSQAQSALAEMVESIRTSRLPAAGSTSRYLNMVIVRANACELICWTDVDRDALHQLELTRYRVDPGSRTLYRDNYGRAADTTGIRTYYQLTAVTPSSVRLVGNWVSNNTDSSSDYLFHYYDSSGTEMSVPVSDPTLIREVRIDLKIDVVTGAAPIAHELKSVVQPRNLRQY